MTVPGFSVSLGAGRSPGLGTAPAMPGISCGPGSPFGPDYMDEDVGYNRFFSYISLFTFSMLMLVMSNNMLQLFFGWEAVGLVSYLLIGFWFNKPTAIFANMKAFLVNRVGDFGFILGIGLIAAYTNTLNYTEIFTHARELAAQMMPDTD